MRVLKALSAAISLAAATTAADFNLVVGGGEDAGVAGQPFPIIAQDPSADNTPPAPPTNKAIEAAMAKLPKSMIGDQEMGFDVRGFVTDALAPRMGSLEGKFEMVRVKIVDAASGKLSHFWDFERVNKFDWVPQDDGTYEITVTGRRLNGTEETLTTTATINPSEGVTSSTMPLVLHFATPACAEGSHVSAQFREVGSDKWTRVPARPCRGEDGTNFYLGGIHESTGVEAQYKVDDGEWSSSSFGKTGAMDVDIPFANTNIQGLPKSNTEEGIILQHHLFTRPHDGGKMVGGTFAMDMDGEVVWYFRDSWEDLTHKPMFMFWTPTFSKSELFLAAHGEPSLEFPHNPAQILMQRTLKTYDLAGNTVGRCDVYEINKQLEERGNHPIYQFHHDSFIKEDGNILAMIANEKVYDGDFPGFEGKKVVVAIDGFIELTRDCEVKFMWSWLDHVDPKTSPPKQDTRCDVPFPAASSCGYPFAALSGETITDEDPNGVWIDWSHANAIQYIPEDGSVIFDSRNQNNVLKINYARGKGDGKIIWELGKDGDFEVIPAHEGEQHPWFSAQHSPRLYNNRDLVIFDNSNQRVVTGLDGPQVGSNSRGQVFDLDQENMIANQTASIELDGFSYYLGSAQRLANGETWFLSGYIMPKSADTENSGGVELMFDSLKEGLHTHSYQYKDHVPEGELQYKMDTEGAFSYRSYKMHNIYEQETPMDFNTCCIDSDCGAGRTCSCECEGVTNADMDARSDERQDDRDDRGRNLREREHPLRALLFGASGGEAAPQQEKCGCVGFL